MLEKEEETNKELYLFFPASITGHFLFYLFVLPDSQAMHDYHIRMAKKKREM